MTGAFQESLPLVRDAGVEGSNPLPTLSGRNDAVDRKAPRGAVLLESAGGEGTLLRLEEDWIEVALQ